MAKAVLDSRAQFDKIRDDFQTIRDLYHGGWYMVIVGADQAGEAVIRSLQKILARERWWRMDAVLVFLGVAFSDQYDLRELVALLAAAHGCQTLNPDLPWHWVVLKRGTAEEREGERRLGLAVLGLI